MSPPAEAKTPSTGSWPSVLILTPVKDASHYANGYFSLLRRLSYPARLLSLGILESDSRDNTFEVFCSHCETHKGRFRRVYLCRKDFGFRLPVGMPRWEPSHSVAAPVDPGSESQSVAVSCPGRRDVGALVGCRRHRISTRYHPENAVIRKGHRAPPRRQGVTAV